MYQMLAEVLCIGTIGVSREGGDWPIAQCLKREGVVKTANRPLLQNRFLVFITVNRDAIS